MMFWLLAVELTVGQGEPLKGSGGPGSRQSPQQRTESVTLDPYTCDLNLTLDQSGCLGTPLTKDGFALLWAGARATHGVTQGSIYYHVQITNLLDVPHLSSEERNPHVLRVGFSCKYTSLQLGEDSLSCGYGGTGKAVLNGQYKNYGVRFSKGDVVTAYLDFERVRVVVSFAVNGVHQGVAYTIDRQELNGRALYPHVLSRNCQFLVTFGRMGRWVPQGLDFFKPLDKIPENWIERCDEPPDSVEDCEILVMCGLPGSGKTTWVQDICSRFPEKNFFVLGTDNIMERMQVYGLAPHKYGDRYKALSKLATSCFNVLSKIASQRMRNYIIDQTNVFDSARERKMRNFQNFHRVAVVVVPSDQEYRKRIFNQKESGKIVPDKAILNMKGNFSIPVVGEVFDDVQYAEMSERQAEELVRWYNTEGGIADLQSAERQQSRSTSRLDREIANLVADLNLNDEFFPRQETMNGYRGSHETRGNQRRRGRNYANNDGGGGGRNWNGSQGGNVNGLNDGEEHQGRRHRNTSRARHYELEEADQEELITGVRDREEVPRGRGRSNYRGRRGNYRGRRPKRTVSTPDISSGEDSPRSPDECSII